MHKNLAIVLSLVGAVGIALSARQLSSAEKSKTYAKGGRPMTLSVTSTAFKEGEKIPVKYACDGSDISPPINWSSLPEKTKSVALIADDPDAPMGTWVHWVVYNIPPDMKGLPEGVSADQLKAKGANQGTNSFKKTPYGGPCPPGGVHRYFFKIYALDTTLNLNAGATKQDLLKAMEGHILAEGQLVGKYSRK